MDNLFFISCSRLTEPSWRNRRKNNKSSSKTGLAEMIRDCAKGAKLSRCSSTNSRGKASPVQFFANPTNKKTAPERRLFYWWR